MKIDPANKPLLRLADDHPAKAFLLAHREFKERWVGFEIQWPQRAGIPDLVWHSDIENRELRLSGVLYKYISYTPVLTDWLNPSPTLSDHERWSLSQIDTIEALIEEAKSESSEARDEFHAQLFHELQVLLDIWRRSITQRIRIQQQEGTIK